MRRYFVYIICVLTLLHSAAPAFSQERVDTTAQAIRVRIDSIIAGSPVLMERAQLGLYVYDLTADSALYTHGHRQQMRPASCQKVLTSITALDRLGSKHAFRTKLTMVADTLAADSTHWYGNLAVKGGMDPTLGSEDLQAMAAALRKLVPDTIVGNLIIDLSFKDDSRLGWGWCWDDDNPSLSPLLYNREDVFAEQFLSALRQRGIVVMGGITLGSMPADVKVVCERSTSIDKVLNRMMKRSDNLYAESMFYQLGKTRKRAAEKVSALLTEAGATGNFLQVADGSGLSLYNYTTPEALVMMLRYAHQHQEIFRHFYPSLPIAGTDGTLEKRMQKGAARGNIHAKTGSVTGVSSLAGYATAANGHLLAFAIINQGVSRMASGRAMQDAVCEALCAPLTPRNTTE